MCVVPALSRARWMSIGGIEGDTGIIGDTTGPNASGSHNESLETSMQLEADHNPPKTVPTSAVNVGHTLWHVAVTTDGD